MGLNPQSEDTSQSYRKELNDYLREKKLAINCDPLEYWKSKKDVYNTLSRLARKYLSPPPGSASAERLFSTAKRVLGQHRLNMTPENTEINIFLKYGLQALDYNIPNKPLPDDFIAPNRKQIPKPRSETEALDNNDSIDIYISSDESDEDM